MTKTKDQTAITAQLKKLTIKEIKNLTGLPESTICRWRSGQIPKSAISLLNLMRHLWSQ